METCECSLRKGDREFVCMTVASTEAVTCFRCGKPVHKRWHWRKLRSAGIRLDRRQPARHGLQDGHQMSDE